MTTNVQPKNVIIGLLSIGMLSCSGQPATDATYDRTQAKAEIRDIEQTWAQVAVSGDPAVIERIFADNFVGVAPDGAQYTKQGFIDDTKANPLGFISNDLKEMDVRFEGDGAEDGS